MLYNWSKEGGDRLLEHCIWLATWTRARSSLQASIFAQKSGLFHNQPIIRTTLQSEEKQVLMVVFSIYSFNSY